MPDRVDEFADGCQIPVLSPRTPDEDIPYVVLFAEALEPNSKKTVEEVELEWRELFDAPEHSR